MNGKSGHKSDMQEVWKKNGLLEGNGKCTGNFQVPSPQPNAGPGPPTTDLTQDWPYETIKAELQGMKQIAKENSSKRMLFDKYFTLGERLTAPNEIQAKVCVQRGKSSDPDR